MIAVLGRPEAEEEFAAAWRQAPDGVRGALASARQQIVGRSLVERIQYEYQLAVFLLQCGLSGLAREGLHSFFDDVASTVAGHPTAEERTHAAFALNLLAELQQQAGELSVAEVTAQRAQRLVEAAAESSALARSAYADALAIEMRVLLEFGVFDEAAKRVVRLGRLERGGTLDAEAQIKACWFESEFLLAQDRARKAIERIDRYAAAHSGELPIELALQRGIAALAQAELTGEPAVDAEGALLAQLRAGELEQGTEASARMMLMRAAMNADRLDVAQEHLDRLRKLEHDHHEGASPAGRLAAAIEPLATRLLLSRHAHSPVASIELTGRLQAHRAGFAQWLREIERTAHRPGGAGMLAFMSRRQMLTELIRLTVAVEGPEAAAVHAANDLLAIQRLTSLAREVGVDAVALADVRAALTDSKSGVLVFLAEPRGSFLLAIDKDRQRLIPLPGSVALETDIRALQAGLAALGQGHDAAGMERLRTASQRLRSNLITPEVSQLLAGWDTVTIADYGMLDGLPWECLESADGRLLGEQLSVNTLTSLPVAVTMLRSRFRQAPLADVRMALIATLGGSPRLVGAKAAPFEISTTSAHRLTDHYPDHVIRLNGDATREQVASVSAGAWITQVVAHGAQREAEGETGLALATMSADDDGFFGTADCKAMGLSGLVIITACGSGRAHRRIGDEALYATLGGAFLRTGVHTIVQTSADLHLAASLRLLELAHAGIAAHKTTAIAFRDARAARAADPWADRYEYAQVQVFGLGNKAIVR